MATCKCVKKFGLTCFRWLKYTLKLDIEFNVSTIILSNRSGQHSFFVNNFLTIVKQYVYATKCQKLKLNVAEMLTKIYMIDTDERYFAEAENSVHKLAKRWSVYHENIGMSDA